MKTVRLPNVVPPRSRYLRRGVTQSVPTAVTEAATAAVDPRLFVPLHPADTGMASQPVTGGVISPDVCVQELTAHSLSKMMFL